MSSGRGRRAHPVYDAFEADTKGIGPRAGGGRIAGFQDPDGNENLHGDSGLSRVTYRDETAPPPVTPPQGTTTAARYHSSRSTNRARGPTISRGTLPARDKPRLLRDRLERPVFVQGGTAISGGVPDPCSLFRCDR